jgi:hypothetical protein
MTDEEKQLLCKHYFDAYTTYEILEQIFVGSQDSGDYEEDAEGNEIVHYNGPIDPSFALDMSNKQFITSMSIKEVMKLLNIDDSVIEKIENDGKKMCKKALRQMTLTQVETFVNKIYKGEKISYVKKE